ncbi:low affinity immunoglobulin epsilon Fc receptor-like [Pogonomyrmex barbatus]|uniref:Low affinity immunoglobulin epsilon Fc receptor-like n=1 Tax=Pogonomyrmex barbatus TaxID=144034 RepID=A0A6I9WG09_9HYME|nr:low affinity immunoglobulin epsilon Fc receptor-like [Pogonomyrmex barbatus]XP_011639964.1 low affinity immunoglobulin epsilon Fc receptor-like [Pogonomyrmex barbatus]XP_025074506.1 low affinity immunoglobulin epsilon Fc receptor-like [Pogonomyrmex barbatus]
MGTCWFAVWVLFICFIGDVRPQYRDKNISTAETDAVQALLARYLQRRLQGSQLSTPPPPSVLFNNDHRARIRQATQRSSPSNSLVSRNVSDNDGDHRPVSEDYNDYEDDLEGYEDSERSRTRFDLLADDCPNCVDEHSSSLAASRWTMPLLKLGEKRYYLGIFFKANWYRASQYCRYHGMHLASIASQEENDRLEKHIKDFGLGHEHFWTSGTDQAEEGTFFWMANGRPITFENWNVGEPNNFRYENGEEEHCLELWNRDGKGLKWNDSPCSFETFFVCEVQ